MGGNHSLPNSHRNKLFEILSAPSSLETRTPSLHIWAASTQLFALEVTKPLTAVLQGACGKLTSHLPLKVIPHLGGLFCVFLQRREQMITT